jgi:hypothetical protein
MDVFGRREQCDAEKRIAENVSSVHPVMKRRDDRRNKKPAEAGCH